MTAPAREEALPSWFVEPSFASRLLARLADTLVLAPAIGLIATVTDGVVSTAIGLVVGAMYEIAFVSRGGQTLGKMLLRTRIVSMRDGAVPSIGAAVVRWAVLNAGSIIALAPAVPGGAVALATVVVIFPVLRPPLHRGLHDVAAGTVVTSIG